MSGVKAPSFALNLRQIKSVLPLAEKIVFKNDLQLRYAPSPPIK